MAIRTYRYRLEPTNAQEQKFLVFAGQCRFVWNQLLARANEAHKNGTDFNRTAFGLNYEITKLKAEFEWLSESHIHCLQESARSLAESFSRFFRWAKTRKGHKASFPKFKSRHRSQASFGYKSGVKVDGDKLFLPKIGWVRFRNSRDPIGNLKSARVKQDCCGNWFISVQAEAVIGHLPAVASVAGVDVGLRVFATVCTGDKIEKITSPKFLAKSRRKLAKAQRRLSRKKKGSKNRRKAKLAVAKLHRRISRQREDFQHKLSIRIVRENQTVCVEDLNVSGMFRGTLARSMSDAGLSKFLGMLKYKCDWYGRTLVEAHRFYPSSKTCSCCGQINKELKMEEFWECSGCGTCHNRDENASRNLRAVAAGHAETLNACGSVVSHSLVGAV